MPPPNTPPYSTPVPQLKRGYETGFSPPVETSESTSSKTTDEMRQEVDKRERAAIILGSWEKLSWHSHAYGEKSIPQTRLRLQKIMIGLDDDRREYEWEDEGTKGERDEKGKWREKSETQKRIRKGDGKVRKTTAGNG